jgi:phosphatidylinositol-3-phosphatase
LRIAASVPNFDGPEHSVARLVLTCLVAVLFMFSVPATRGYAAGSVPRFDHIFVIVLENKSYSQIIGNLTQAPYINQLAAEYGLATNYRAITHPSLPNYLALIGGQTFGVTSDCTACFLNAPNLAVDRLTPAGRTWKGYMDAMPRPCFVGDSGRYRQKHNPFIYFDSIRNDPPRCARSVPFSQLAIDLQHKSTTPNFVFITPDMCHDMHDCSIKTGDDWLRGVVPMLLTSRAYREQNSLIVLTWDEDDITKVNHIPTLLMSKQVPAGFRSAVPYTHYSLLRTIEASWGLAPLASNDTSAAPMSDFFPRTTHTLIPVADTYVSRSNPNVTGVGRGGALQATSSGLGTAFLRFDLRSMAGRHVASASLRLHTSSESWAGSPATFDILFVSSDAWQEQSMSYSNAVPISTTSLGTLAEPRNSNTWYAAPLSRALVQSQVGGGLSVAIRSRVDDVLRFNSRESAFPPELVLVLD